MILIITQQLLLVGIGMLGGTILEKRLFLSMPRSVFRKWGIVQLVFAKASAYVAVFLVTSLFSMGILHRWFAFPDQGHLLTILPFLIVYLYTVSFLGLGISMLFKERVQSILFLVFMSPMIVFVSGISWPSSSLPTIIRDISYLFPSTIMVPAYIRLRLIGVGFQSVRIDGLLLFIQMVVYFVFASLAYKFAIGRFSKRISFEHKSDRINP